MLRIGTINYIDSLNPFNYIEAQAYNAMIMIYPQLVQYGAGHEVRGRLGELVGDVGRRQGLDVPPQPGHEVVGRRAADGRRRRLDDQHDRQVRGRRDGRDGRAALAHVKSAEATDRRRS